ncbi:MAG: hypothetical protein ACYCYM_13305 [Saccharofermentanales bacterium]
MKWLSKINRGAILTAFVLLCVIGYLVVLSLIHSAQIPGIEQICEDYLADEIRYSMLPEDQRKDVPDMTETELASYLDEMEQAISAHYPDGEEYSKFAIKAKTADLTAQSEGQGIVYSYTKTIVDFTRYVFDKNTVTVSFLSDTTIETAMTGKAGLPEKTKMTMEVNDQIILFRKDGEWHVIYAGITRPDKNVGMEYPVGR